MKYETGWIEVLAVELPSLTVRNPQQLELYMELYERAEIQRRPILVAEREGKLVVLDGEPHLRALRRKGADTISCFNIGDA